LFGLAWQHFTVRVNNALQTQKGKQIVYLHFISHFCPSDTVIDLDTRLSLSEGVSTFNVNDGYTHSLSPSIYCLLIFAI